MTDDKLLRRAEAAEYLNVSPATLASWATRGGGPPYVKTGRLTLYSHADLHAWLDARKVRNTGEASKLAHAG